jgi:HK97 family phage portal protein
MNILSKLFKRKSINLTTIDRELLFKQFGSFTANKLSLSTDKLLKEGYESNLDVYSVIRKIVELSNSIEWIVEQKTADGWEELEDSTIHDLMANPNRDKGYTWNDIQEQLIIYLLASGNSYLVGENGFSNRLLEVDVLPSPFVCAATNNDFFMPNVRYQFELNQNKRVYEAEDLEHIMLFNPAYTNVQESFNGLSIIQVAARAVQVGNDRWDADAALLQNRGAIGMLSQKSANGGRPMTAEEARAIQHSFQRDTAGTKNFGKVKVTNKDLNFVNMAMSSTDLQLIEKGVVNLRAICNVLGLDSSLFNDPANKTFNNRKEAEKSSYTNAIIPLSNKIAAKHTNFIALNHYPDGNVRMRQDFSKVEALQADKKQEAEKDKIVMEGINVVLNMPVDPASKVLLLQENYDISEELATALTSTNNTGDE